MRLIQRAYRYGDRKVFYTRIFFDDLEISYREAWDGRQPLIRTNAKINKYATVRNGCLASAFASSLKKSGKGM